MSYSLETLMTSCGCGRWPKRWEEVFDAAMVEYDRNGCRLADPGFYRGLDERYGCFPHFLEVFCRAAEQAAADETLGRLLTLLDLVMRDREHIEADCAEFSLPKPPEGRPELGYLMAGGLALASALPYTAEMLKKRGWPEKNIRGTLSMIDGGVREYRKRNGGRDGYHLFDWFQLAIDGKLVRIGRFETEFGVFERKVRVYRDGTGKELVLADGARLHSSGFGLGNPGCSDEEGAWTASLTETESFIEGHTVDLSDGRVSRETVRLDKSIWRQTLAQGDPEIALHIPAGGDFSPETVDASLHEIKEFAARYQPEHRGAVFLCESWMLDPKLRELLGDGSNIVRFGGRFGKLPSVGNGKGVFYFVFLLPKPPEDIASLPEDTRLMRKLKELYSEGGCIRETAGYFFL